MNLKDIDIEKLKEKYYEKYPKLPDIDCYGTKEDLSYEIMRASIQISFQIIEELLAMLNEKNSSAD